MSIIIKTFKPEVKVLKTFDESECNNLDIVKTIVSTNTVTKLENDKQFFELVYDNGNVMLEVYSGRSLIFINLYIKVCEYIKEHCDELPMTDSTKDYWKSDQSAKSTTILEIFKSIPEFSSPLTFRYHCNPSTVSTTPILDYNTSDVHNVSLINHWFPSLSCDNIEIQNTHEYMNEIGVCNKDEFPSIVLASHEHSATLYAINTYFGIKDFYRMYEDFTEYFDTL